MSLKAQPAARIRAAPTKKAPSSQRLGHRPLLGAGQGDACQPGSISSQIPGRPVEAAQLQPRPQGARRVAVDPVGGGGVGQARGHGVLSAPAWS
jgi:hypothetical protein